MKRDLVQETRRHFDKQAQKYDEMPDGKFSSATYEEIRRRVRRAGATRLLDIGCGNGNVLKSLADDCIELAGLDLSEKMVEEARAKLGDRAVIKAGNAQELPFADDSMDYIVCNASFHHYPQPEKVLKEMRRVLVSGGILLIGDPNPPLPMRLFINATSPFTGSGDYRMYSRGEFETLLRRCGLEMFDWQKPNLLTCIFEAREPVIE